LATRPRSLTRFSCLSATIPTSRCKCH
jgi:hypothetical protein